MNPGPPLSASPAACRLCGLPLLRSARGSRASGFSDHYCCYGCYLTHSVTGNQGEESLPVVFLARLGMAAFLSMNVMTLTWSLYGDRVGFLFPVEEGSRGPIAVLIFLLSIPVYLLVGIPFLKNAWEEFRRLRPGVDSLIALGTSAAFLVSVHAVLTGGRAIYFDTATMVLVLVTFGRYLEAHARVRTGQALRSLFTKTIVSARLLTPTGDEVQCDPASLRPGDLFRVLPGETIPLDGVIMDGETSVNESLLTGESFPQRRVSGNEVVGGSVNCDGFILVRATRTGDDSLLGRLTRLMERLQTERTPLQMTADRITRVFVPSVILLAALSGLFWGIRGGFAEGILNGLSVLLIACPCALGIGATIAGALGYTIAAKRGVLLGSISALEIAGGVTEVLLDKTGTLTEGELTAREFVPVEGGAIDRDLILSVCVALESRSEHPVGQALKRMHCVLDPRECQVVSSRVLVGRGIEGDVRDAKGRQWKVLIQRGEDNIIENVFVKVNSVTTCSYVFLDDVYTGMFVFEDSLRGSARPAVQQLIQMGIRTSIVSGDSDLAVRSTLKSLGGIIGGVGSVLPEGKVRLVQQTQQRSAVVAMVGDGINDAASLAASDLGITLRSGTDLSRLAADATIMDDSLLQLPWLFAFGRKVRRTIRWNFFWAFAYNTAGILLAMAGLLEPVWAAGAMVASSILVITNSTRLDRISK